MALKHSVRHACEVGHPLCWHTWRACVWQVLQADQDGKRTNSQPLTHLHQRACEVAGLPLAAGGQQGQHGALPPPRGS